MYPIKSLNSQRLIKKGSFERQNIKYGKYDIVSSSGSDSGGTYVWDDMTIKALSDYYVGKITYWTNSSNGILQLEIKTSNDKVIWSGKTPIKSTAGSWYTFVIPVPILFKKNVNYKVKFTWTNACTLRRRTSSLYSGTLWAMVDNYISNGSHYSETPYWGLYASTQKKGFPHWRGNF